MAYFKSALEICDIVLELKHQNDLNDLGWSYEHERAFLKVDKANSFAIECSNTLTLRRLDRLYSHQDCIAFPK